MDEQKEYPKRTVKQSNAVHLWFRLIAEELNNAGYEQKITIGTVEVPWSEASVKILFKKIGRYQFNKPKTSGMTTKELTEVAETLNRYLGEAGKVHIPFPSIEEIIFQQTYGQKGER